MSGDHYITQHIGCYYLTSYCLKFSHIYLVKIFCTLLGLSKTPIFFPYLQNTKHFDRSVSPTVWRSSQCHLPLWFDSFIGMQRNLWLSVLLHTLWNISCIDWVMIVLFTWSNWWTRWIRHRTLFYPMKRSEQLSIPEDIKRFYIPSYIIWLDSSCLMRIGEVIYRYDFYFY